jgi:hypothetical protein
LHTAREHASRRRAWLDDAEFAILEYVDWFNHGRLGCDQRRADHRVTARITVP